MSDDGQPKATARLAADEGGIVAAAALIRAGGLAAFPTETVYGLGADATDAKAVAGIYAAKGRPSFNPLIAHVADAAAAAREGVFDARAEALAAAFWPGPLTLVLPVAPRSSVCDLARAGLATLALRVPAHPLALALMEAVGRPVAAPSANRSGHVSPTSADHVMAELAGRIDAVLDGGSTRVGIESTIVACLGGAPTLLRPGGVASADVSRVVGLLRKPTDAGVSAPGMLSSHYAPRAGLRLNALALEEGEAGLDFAGRLGRGALDLSPGADLTEAAANLYDWLRRLDAAGPRRRAVAPVPAHSLGEAINDRLRRAAAPRER